METFSSSKTQSWLSWFLKGLLLLGFLILVGRLIDLQIIRGNYFKDLAEGNRIRRVSITAPRGKILARGGEVLVGNREVEKRVDFDPEEGYKKIDDTLSANKEELVTEPIRIYELGADLAHVSGYLGEVNQQELGKIQAECLEKGVRSSGALIGRSGLEEEYDCILRGINGEIMVEVDVNGMRVRTLGSKDPVAGSDIKTTIDFGLQTKIAEIISNAEDLPLGKRGAVVVTDTAGEVLALYSSPSFDPNIFIAGDNKSIVQVFKDKNLPLFNRVIGGNFHPGSVYKPMVAVAALEENIVDEDYIYEDTGVVTTDSIYGKYSYTNWYFTQYGGVEGKIDLPRALARSTDTFFYKVGGLLGVDKLVEWSEKFGLNKATGIDLPGEIDGFVPSPLWKLDAKGERWFLGNTYHMSIGQGDIALTPMGIHMAISSMAADGFLCKPRIVNDGELVNGQWSMVNGRQRECRDLEIRKESLKLVKQGMLETCRPEGTAFTFFDFKEKYGIDVACKTGTAETTDDSEPHAWFVAYAPAFTKPALPAGRASAGKPASSEYVETEIVVTVLIENGGEGSKIAGPIAREIFDYYFGESTQDEQD